MIVVGEGIQRSLLWIKDDQKTQNREFEMMINKAELKLR